MCACTHYLVFKEPTGGTPLAPRPTSRLATHRSGLRTRRGTRRTRHSPYPPERPDRLPKAACLGEPFKVTRFTLPCQDPEIARFHGRVSRWGKTPEVNAARNLPGRISRDRTLEEYRVHTRRRQVPQRNPATKRGDDRLLQISPDRLLAYDARSPDDGTPRSNRRSNTYQIGRAHV